MTHCTPKSDKQWKRYKSNIETCVENDICLLLYLYLELGNRSGQVEPLTKRVNFMLVLKIA